MFGGRLWDLGLVLGELWHGLGPGKPYGLGCRPWILGYNIGRTVQSHGLRAQCIGIIEGLGFWHLGRRFGVRECMV